MKNLENYKLHLIILLVILLIGVSCTKKHDDDPESDAGNQKAKVYEQGNRIVFPDSSPGEKLISVKEVKSGSALISVVAPSRVVATISSAVSSNDKIILFDSPDVTSLYSQYRQSRTYINLYTKNLTRVKQMFDNQVATSKDVNQAENDLTIAKATVSEMEGRLRTSGFNPQELENASTGTAWIFSDVPESQLKEVQLHEDVDIVFSSYPDKVFIGIVNSIGEVIDPVTRSVKVRVTMKNNSGKLIPGMFAKVDYGDPMDNVFVLPPSAVATVDGKDYVFIEKAPHEYIRRGIIIEHSSTNEIVVVKGLSNGEKVVTEGALLLKGLSFGY